MGPREVLGLRFPAASAGLLLQLPLLGRPLASGPCPRVSYLELQLPDASERRTFQRGLPSSLLGEEPRPLERLPRLSRRLPPASAISRDAPPPTDARRGRRAVARGGGAAGGGPWRGRSGARERSSLATAVAPGARGGFALAGGLALSRALRGPVVGGGREEEVGTPRPTGPACPRSTREHRLRRGGGGFAPAPRCPRRPGLSEAGEPQAGASGFLLFSPPKVLGWRRAKVGTGIGAEGKRWGRRGRSPDFASPSWGGERAGRPSCLPGDAPRLVLALAVRLG